MPPKKRRSSSKVSTPPAAERSAKSRRVAAKADDLTDDATAAETPSTAPTTAAATTTTATTTATTTTATTATTAAAAGSSVGSLRQSKVKSAQPQGSCATDSGAAEGYVKDLLKTHDDLEVTVADTGRTVIKCTSTGHEMPMKRSAVLAYVGSKRYRQKRDWYKAEDFEKYLPFIVPHKDNSKKLYSVLTRHVLNMIPSEVEAEFRGKKFQAKLKEHVEAEVDREAENDSAEEAGGDDDEAQPSAAAIDEAQPAAAVNAASKKTQKRSPKPLKSQKKKLKNVKKQK